MRIATLVSSSFAVLAAAVSASFAGQTLSTDNSTDGGVTVEVDAYGAFGSSAGTDADNAFYNPVGPLPAGTIGTTFQSATAIRVGGGGGVRQYLATGVGFPTLPIIAQTGNGTTATSSFSVLGLNAGLTQTVSSIVDDDDVRIGSQLTQTYTFANPGAAPVALETVRYIDADINASLGNDGGGRFITSGGVEYLFETDTATGASVATTLVGITARGALAGVDPTVPAAGRYQISAFPGLRDLIEDGVALNNVISGDGGDPDQFIDAGPGYDVTLGLTNQFNIPAGGSVTYTTTTVFGTFAPSDIPEPTTLTALAGVAGLMLARRRK